MGHGLAQEVFLVFAVKLQVEAQQVFVKVGNPGFLPAQLEADFRAREGAFEKGFGLLVTGFDAGFEQFGHIGEHSWPTIMPQPPLHCRATCQRTASGRLCGGLMVTAPMLLYF
ncbi:hypothetical protein D3C75_1117590 [compost metagenome]